MFGRRSPTTEADLRRWIKPYLDPDDADTPPGMSDGLIVGLRAVVAELVVSGQPVPLTTADTWVVLTDSSLMVVSAERVLVVKWFLIQMWQLRGPRMFVGWLSPTMQTLDSIVVDLDRAHLRSQPEFEPVAKRLLERAQEALTDIQLGGFAEIRETIDARDSGRIGPEDSAAHIALALAAMQTAGGHPEGAPVSLGVDATARRPAPKRR